MSKAFHNEDNDVRIASMLLEKAGKLRMNAAADGGPEGDYDRSDEHASSMPTPNMPKIRSMDETSSFTPLMGKYGQLWNITLWRRIEEGKDLFFEPIPDSRTRL